MAPTNHTRDVLLWGCMFTCLTLGQGFFLPSFSSSYPKKSEVAAVQWPAVRDSVYYGQHYHGGTAVPVAVPYPVAVPAPAQVALQAAPPTASGSSGSLQATYHNTQLVPCLCSVPKDDLDDSTSVVVQSSQQISN
ncbi:uncharacterized protein LOC110827714 isoform X2 [Zootermopsis nevadensis]|uniref:uncharacterized protein LOC110827714 isoform X2 n=1 Tax=Zootermopsis nevadensis TaxID=136037 RepID=UPI000B8E4F14|nr:uncharacterized protein LOC110827714 isoform X2 [Zootermopsis nevadensis]